MPSSSPKTKTPDGGASPALPQGVGCVIMASGLARRFGANKLMADFGGEPLISRILHATQGLFARRIVITRHADVAALCKAYGAACVLHNLPHRNDTIRLGIEQMEGLRACMFCPSDQPLLTRETISALVQHAAQEPDAIWRAAHGADAGLPAVFPQWAFPLLCSLPEGKGGGYVIRQYEEKVRTVQVKSALELADVDYPEDLAALKSYI